MKRRHPSSSKKAYEAALRWVAGELDEAAAKVQPDPDELAQAFRILFHAPPDAPRSPAPSEQWFLVRHKVLQHKPSRP